jgi:hypothetical protein
MTSSGPPREGAPMVKETAPSPNPKGKELGASAMPDPNGKGSGVSASPDPKGEGSGMSAPEVWGP